MLTSLSAIPSAALPASGSMGIISARYYEAPLIGRKGSKKEVRRKSLGIRILNFRLMS